jgi:hypothetical protein
VNKMRLRLCSPTSVVAGDSSSRRDFNPTEVFETGWIPCGMSSLHLHISMVLRLYIELFRSLLARIIHERFCCKRRSMLKRDGRDWREKRDSKLPSILPVPLFPLFSGFATYRPE